MYGKGFVNKIFYLKYANVLLLLIRQKKVNLSEILNI